MLAEDLMHCLLFLAIDRKWLCQTLSSVGNSIRGHLHSTYAQKWSKLDLPPLPPWTQLYAFGLTLPLPLCEYLLCGWPLIVLLFGCLVLLGLTKESINYMRGLYYYLIISTPWAIANIKVYLPLLWMKYLYWETSRIASEMRQILIVSCQKPCIADLKP